MKHFLALGLIALAFMFNSCQEDIKPTEKATINITSGVTDSTINFLFTSNQPNNTYAIGVLTEEELTDIGGKDSLTQFITTQLNEGTANIKSQFPELYDIKDAHIGVKYYAWAVQLNEGAIYGEPVLSDAASIVIEFYEYFADYYLMAPFAISANGRYVCGTDDQKTSYIIDLATRTVEKDIEGINLRTIDNNGMAYGYGLKMQACTYKDGEITPLHSIHTGNIFDVTADGSMAGGYQSNNAIIFRNGTLDTLSVDGECLYGPYDNTAEDWYHEDNPWIYSTVREACVTSIAENGVCGGFVVDEIWSIDLACYWDAKGEIHIFGAQNAEYDTHERWFHGQIESHSVIVSPNGKYIACAAHGSLIIFDSETGERSDIPAEGAALGNVVAITNDGNVYINNGTAPVIYTQEGGFDLLNNYIEDEYGKVFTTPIQGNLIGVSDNGKRILTAVSVGDMMYAARVHFIE